MSVFDILRIEARTLLKRGSARPATAPEETVTLAEVERIFEDGRFNRRFSRAIELRFWTATAEARFAFFHRMAAVGICLYALFTPIDLLIIPDVFWLAFTLQVGIGTPISIATDIVIRYYGLRSHALASVAIVTMMTTTWILFVATRSPHADTVAEGFAIIIVACNVGVGLPFRWALGITGAALAAIVPAIFLHPSLDLASQVFATVLNVALAMFSLVGNHRIESSVRRSFLFALRESLRADQLAVTNRVLHDLATLDGLTGIANRRHFDATLARAWDEADGRPLGLLLIDIDHFKLFNDRFGHPAGDDCLRIAAGTLVASASTVDALVARYGGEEFAVLLEGADIVATMVTAERLRSDVAAVAPWFATETEQGPITVSIGCAIIVPGPTTASSDLVAAADAALYAAKLGGRNCVRAAGSDTLRDIASRPSAVSIGRTHAARSAVGA